MNLTKFVIIPYKEITKIATLTSKVKWVRIALLEIIFYVLKEIKATIANIQSPVILGVFALWQSFAIFNFC